MSEAVLSLDIGTTTAKGVIFDLTGREVAVAEQGLQLHTPQPGWVEMDPQEIWAAVLQVLRTLITEKNSAVPILALALSTQGGSLVPVKADGTLVYNLITWLDRRSQGLVDNWQRTGLDRTVREISGWSLAAGLPLASICALRQAQPNVFENAARFLSLNDFLVHKLTGFYATNPSMAGEMLLTDIRTGQWSEDLCTLAGIRTSQLSPIIPSDAIVGDIQAAVCEMTGLPVHTPLIAGGQDHSCEALALGLTAAGKFWLACGTAWVLNGVAERVDLASLTPEMSLNFHVLPGRWTMSRFLGGLGAGLEWWLEQCWHGTAAVEGRSRQEQLRSFNTALAGTAPGSSGLLAIPISGASRGGIVAPGGFCGLRLDHTAADMGRAIMESAAFELRWALEETRRVGHAVDQLWMVGGAAHSPHWPQILADINQIPVLLSQYSHGPALGAAILAYKSLGLMDEYPEWVSARTVAVNDHHTSLYDRTFATYQQAAWGREP